jgi:hypothetical protein
MMNSTHALRWIYYHCGLGGICVLAAIAACGAWAARSPNSSASEPTAQSATPQRISAKSPIANLVSAAGDGVTDDTDALQARIDWALEHGAVLELEAGTYLISRTLHVQQPNGRSALGFEINGLAGPNRDGDRRRGGVCIMLVESASNPSAILELGGGNFRDMRFSNFSLISRVPGAATRVGLYVADTGFSHLVLQNIFVRNVDTAFQISEGSARNGEAFDLYECQGSQCRRFYANSAGQAYLHRMFGCSGDLLNGGTFITIGGEHLGFNLDAFGSSVSFGRGPLQNTFIRNNGISGCVGLWGGRVEICDTLLSYTGGSYTCTGIVTARGIEFTDYSGAHPLIEATNVSNTQWTNLFESCAVNSVPHTSPKLKFGALPQGDKSRTTFQGCVFRGMSTMPEAREAKDMGVLFRDCRATSGKDPVLRDVNLGG